MIAKHFYNQLHACSLATLANTPDPDLDAVEAVLNKRTSAGLDADDVAVLLKTIGTGPESTHALHKSIIDAAAALRKKVFGNKVATMVPVELTSWCQSNCHFCGWRSDNQDMPRMQISRAGMIAQVVQLVASGITHIELSGGDDLIFIKKHLKTFIAELRQTLDRINPKVRISLCMTPMLESHYKELKAAGLDTVLTWQETYNRDLFHSIVSRGPKANGITEDMNLDRGGDGFLARLRSQEFAVRAGLQVGIGAMIGLCDPIQADILSVVKHIHGLRDAYPEMLPVIIGMPTWNKITTENTDNFASGLNARRLDVNEYFELVSAIYLLSLPDGFAWVFPNCRVNHETQIRSILTAGAFTSTSVKVGPGAYLSGSGTAMKDVIERSSVPTESIDDDILAKGEQFTHFYEEHGTYARDFREQGLDLTDDHQILACYEASKTAINQSQTQKEQRVHA